MYPVRFITVLVLHCERAALIGIGFVPAYHFRNPEVVRHLERAPIASAQPVPFEPDMIEVHVPTGRG